MMPKIILIPAAGEGKRFQQKGILNAKPLIKVKGKTLLEYTIDCFDINNEDRLIIAVLKKHRIKEKLATILENKYRNIYIYWLEIDECLPGQLATSVQAIKYLKTIDPIAMELQLLIHNCDTGFLWSKNLEKIKGFASMPVFEAEGEHWSFGKPDPLDPQFAIQIAEKKRISNLASIGLYIFRNAITFLKIGEEELKSGEKINGENYIAPLLQNAIRNGEKVEIPKISGVKSYGTPEDLCKNFSISLKSLKELNA